MVEKLVQPHDLFLIITGFTSEHFFICLTNNILTLYKILSESKNLFTMYTLR